VVKTEFGGMRVTPRAELDLLLGVVEERIRAFLFDQRTRWSRINEQASGVIDAVADLIDAGGKRLRPRFCLAGYLAAGGEKSGAAVIPAAAALELLHACALIHDDIMDEAATRRGRPTVHTRNAAEHARRQWRGDPGRFGENVGILAGDLALVYADQFMVQAPSGVNETWGELRSELIIGQYMDVVSAATPGDSPALARWIAKVKSGSYTIHRPLVVGCIAAGRPELADAFAAYGAALGEAFQLRDDLLNAFGDPGVTGKPGDLDLQQGKMTLLLTLAMRRDDRLAHPRADARETRVILEESGARDELEKYIGQLVDRAGEAIAAAPLEEEWRTELAAMAYEVAYRER
jgi:geranylgeranyl diphosphate synthase, type I